MKKLSKKFEFSFGIFIAVFLVLFVTSAIAIRQVYQNNLSAISTEKKAVSITVEPGSTVSEIALNLKNKGAIKSDWAFEWYVRNNNLREELKAGTYLVYTNQSVPEIAKIIASGKVATDLFTILPGKRVDEIRTAFLKAGYSQSEVEDALNPNNYKGHEALTDLPDGANLDGYLYPESYQKTAETSAKTIVKQSLDEMARRLTKERRQQFAKNGLTTHQAVALASVIENEVGNKNDRAQVSQVFLQRLKIGMKLESNATDEYAKINPAYDTYKIAGLPPGPISNVSESSLEAVAFPATTDWLYFVSGDDGITHFSKTLEEHEALTKKYCKALCQ